MTEFPSFEQVLEAQNYSIQLQLQHWLRYEVFTFQFWLLIAMLIVPWIVWWRLVDKKRFLAIVIYGLLVMTVVTFLDEIGCQMNLWEYRYDLEPLFPRLIPVNFSILPVYYMLVYQYYPKWKEFLLANTVAAAFYTYIGEPLLMALHIYEMIEWKLIYSFPIYIILAVFFKIVLDAILRIQRQAS